MGENEGKLKLVFTGHVDHGKSTVIGRLLFDTGSLPQGAIDKIKAVTLEKGKAFEFAYLLDAFEEERTQGITIDTTQLAFKTKKRDYVIIDAPGHVEFLKNMISGAADAEAAFLVVDAQRGLEEQSRRHAHMLSILGVRQTGLIVNKMDLVGFKEKVFGDITREAWGFFDSLGLAKGPSIPLAALPGDNVVKRSDNFSWYNGPSLIEALDDLRISPREEKDLRLPIQDVYKFDDRRILAGRIESGRLRVGDEVTISPGGKRTLVASLPAWLDRDVKDEVGRGESVGLIVKDEFFNRRGDVVSHVGRAPEVADSFLASIFWLGKTPLNQNARYRLKLGASETEARVNEIVHLIDSTSLAPRPAQGEIKQNEVAVVALRLKKAIPVDLFSKHTATGRFVLLDGYDVSGGGIVTQIHSRADIRHGFVFGELKARCEVFEEYYYSLGDMAVNKVDRQTLSYTVGDPVPLSGLSYKYPDYFDIVIFRDQMVVQIRAAKVDSLKPLAEYDYQGLPLVNGRGFGLLVQSPDDWDRAKGDFLAQTPETEPTVAKRWLDFNAYRRIPMGWSDFVI
ncbi:MAG: 50S ribosome-binding GTPase [Deltaproteobacteria bacterium]|jgi:bifunctional enzyme CysN/CysC/sulfate adenylyltransferase subunit 1|nr:50S ribosome-binding GTPase [Deltaproteobacteria bacterium]